MEMHWLAGSLHAFHNDNSEQKTKEELQKERGCIEK